MDVKDSYKSMNLRILSNFQLLELALKIYIGKAYELIKICLTAGCTSIIPCKTWKTILLRGY